MYRSNKTVSKEMDSISALATMTFSANVVLVPGQNIFELTGISIVTDKIWLRLFWFLNVKSQHHRLFPFQIQLEQIKFRDQNFQFIGSVLNVTAKTQVKVSVNGQNFSEFQFYVFKWKSCCSS